LVMELTSVRAQTEELKRRINGPGAIDGPRHGRAEGPGRACWIHAHPYESDPTFDPRPEFELPTAIPSRLRAGSPFGRLETVSRLIGSAP